jgi:hypothetical protein
MIIAPPPKITRSWRKWMNSAHPSDFVSSMDLARSHPIKPAISAPNIPLGVPKKCSLR